MDNNNYKKLLHKKVEPDNDLRFAYCPELEAQGAATWGRTREESIDNLEQVLKLVLDSLKAHGDPLPKV